MAPCLPDKVFGNDNNTGSPEARRHTCPKGEQSKAGALFQGFPEQQ
jgi:hypothetical protein